MRDFTVPRTDTRKLGTVELDYAFQIRATFDAPSEMKTPRGMRVVQLISGGEVKGPKLNGKVNAYSGGEYSQLRADQVEDLNSHFMLNAASGEWIYIEHIGYYRRSDGYYRAAAYFDASKQGEHAWLNNAVLLATATVAKDRREILYTYYEAV
jgi:hypothetical protein